MAQKSGIKIVAQNKKARHDYFIEETYETGIELVGTEVKSIRLGQVNLRDCYAQVANGELWVHHMHVSPYEKGNIFNRDPLRSRRLLMHKNEIRKLIGAVQQQGYALIPLQLYLSHGLVKVELGLARGKKNYDKRHDMAERDAKRDIDRAFKNAQREG